MSMTFDSLTKRVDGFGSLKKRVEGFGFTLITEHINAWEYHIKIMDNDKEIIALNEGFEYHGVIKLNIWCDGYEYQLKEAYQL